MIHREYIAEIPIDFGNKDELLKLAASWLGKSERPRQIVTLNALMLISAIENYDFNKLIKKVDLVTVDGYGILLALRKKGYLDISQLTGLELSRSLLSYSMSMGYPVYFYGGNPETARMLKQSLTRNWPGLKICAVRDGYGISLKQSEVREEIIQKQPALLLTGIGSPAQELFLADVLPYLKNTVGIGVGGALDVISGLKKETPLFMRKNCLEWLYRMFQNPVKFKRFPDLVKFWYKFL